MRSSLFLIVALTALAGVANAQDAPLATQEPPVAIEQLPMATQDVFALLDEGLEADAFSDRLREPRSSWPCSGSMPWVPSPEDRVFTLRILPPLADGTIRYFGPCADSGRYLRYARSAFLFDELPLGGNAEVPDTLIPQTTPLDDTPAPGPDDP